MTWKMHEYESGGYGFVNHLRVNQNVPLKDLVNLLVYEDTYDSFYNIERSDEDIYEHIYKKWSKENIKETVKRILKNFGESHFDELEDYIIDDIDTYEYERRKRAVERVLTEKYNLDEFRKQYGYEPKFKSKGKGRGWHGQPARHSMARRRGL